MQGAQNWSAFQDMANGLIKATSIMPINYKPESYKLTRLRVPDQSRRSLVELLFGEGGSAAP
jgi:hypothetical protein